MSIGLPLVCLLGCPKPIPEAPKVMSDHPLRDKAKPLELQMSQTGLIEDGVYIDSTKLFSVEVPEDWIVEEGNPFGERRLFMRHRVEEYHIEIWRIPGTQYRPVPREDCLWAFVDRGLYSDWSENRTVNVATCYPTNDSHSVIFVYLKHWKGSTWQLEGHVSLDVLVEGERETRALIQNVNWGVDVPTQTSEFQ